MCFYEQGYYYGSMKDVGLNIYNCSDSGKKDIMLKYITKRSKEFEDGLPAEYTEYSDLCKSVCYVAAVKIDQGEYNLRYDTLHHIFIPTESSDINDPYSYIKYVFPYYYNSSKSLRSPLERVKIPKISEILTPSPENDSENSDELLYHRLLSYCMLDGEKNTPKFAKLLELAYNIMLRDEKAAVILPDEMFDNIDMNNIPEDMGEAPQNCYQFAAALMLILHLLVPDCFSSFNSQDKLRIKLMYSIVENTLSKRGLFFIKNSNAMQSKKTDCPTFDIYNFNGEYPKNKFYYVLAEKAQTSILSMKSFLDEMCKMKNGEKFSCRQENLRHLALDNLLKTYNSYLPRRTIATAEYLILFEQYISIIKNGNENAPMVYYPEYITNLLNFNGHGQLHDDKTRLGFWKNLKAENFRDVDSTVFLLEEFEEENNFIKCINEVVSNESVCKKLSKNKNILLWDIIKRISEKDGLKDLCTVSELLENISDKHCEFYENIKSDVVENAKLLYNQLSQSADKHKWYDILKALIPVDELDKFVYENTVTDEDVSCVEKKKTELDINNGHDLSVLRKMMFHCFGKFSELFQNDKNENSNKNKKEVDRWNSVFIDIAQNFSDEQKPENFREEISAQGKYYKKYKIQHANSYYEIKQYTDDDEMQEYCIERLACILPDFKEPGENNNLTELKNIFDWNRQYGEKFEGRESYDKFKQSLESIYGHFSEAVKSQKDYEYLRYADIINDKVLKEKTWDTVSTEDFSEITYLPQKPLFEHIKVYLFYFYKNFAHKNLYSEIEKFKYKFSNNGMFQNEINTFIRIDNIKKMCRLYEQAMANYYNFAQLLDTNGLYRIIYNNFEGDIPKSNDNANLLCTNTRKYEYMIKYPEKIEKNCTDFSQIDVSLLNYDEKKDFDERMENHIRKSSKQYENDIFDLSKVLEISFEKWKKFIDEIEKEKNIILNADNLKQELTFSLFDRIIEAGVNENYIGIAEKLDVDEPRKKKLSDVKAALKEKTTICGFKKFFAIEQSLEKGEIIFSDMLWKQMKSIFSDYISFGEYKSWISILSKYASENQEAQEKLSQKRESIRSDVNKNNFKDFWLLFADDENYGFLADFWKKIDMQETFPYLCSSIPKGYTIEAMCNDIFRMTANRGYDDVKIHLFVFYVLLKTSKNKELLSGRKNIIKSKCNVDNENIKDENLRALKKMLLFTIDECTKNIIENNDIFCIIFELADILKDKFSYIHIDMAKVFDKDSSRKFMREKANLILSNNYAQSPYKDLTVLENTLIFVLIDSYISISFLTAKNPDMYMCVRELALKHYNTLLNDDYKTKLQKKICSEFGENISFHDLKKLISTLCKYADKNDYVRKKLSEQMEIIKDEVETDNFEHFWLLFAYDKNYEFLTDFWKKIKVTQDFYYLYSSLPEKYGSEEMEQDILKMFGNKCIKTRLFVFYAVLKKGCKKDSKEFKVLTRQRNLIVGKCKDLDENVRKENIISLQEALPFIIYECAENIVKVDDILCICFELADALKDEFPYIHIDMANAFYKESSENFMVKTAKNLILYKDYSQTHYKDLIVLENTLKYVLIRIYIHQEFIDTSPEGKKMRQLVFEADSDENNILIPDTLKAKLKEHWYKIIEQAEDTTRGKIERAKLDIIKDIKAHLGIKSEINSADSVGEWLIQNYNR